MLYGRLGAHVMEPKLKLWAGASSDDASAEPHCLLAVLVRTSTINPLVSSRYNVCHSYYRTLPEYRMKQTVHQMDRKTNVEQAEYDDIQINITTCSVFVQKNRIPSLLHSLSLR